MILSIILFIRMNIFEKIFIEIFEYIYLEYLLIFDNKALDEIFYKVSLFYWMFL